MGWWGLQSWWEFLRKQQARGRSVIVHVWCSLWCHSYGSFCYYVLSFPKACCKFSFPFAITILLLHEWELRLVARKLNIPSNYRQKKGWETVICISIWSRNTILILVFQSKMHFGTYHSLAESPLWYLGTKPKAVSSKDEHKGSQIKHVFRLPTSSPLPGPSTV